MGLISREEAIKAVLDMHDCYNGFSDSYDKATIIGVLEEVPGVKTEAITVRKGKWMPYKYATPGYEYKFHECSACGCCDEYVSDVTRPNGTMVRIESVRNFCPNCGADMRGEQNG